MSRTNLQISLLLTAMTISAVLILTTAGNTMRQEKSARVEQVAAATEPPPIGFVMKAYQGKIALFRENSEQPFQILDFETYLLPDADREALEQGIYADTQEELLSILEDWDG